MRSEKLEKFQGDAMNFIAIVKTDDRHRERYIFLYDNKLPSLEKLREVVRQFADDPELSFTQEDADTICAKLP